MDRIWMDPAVGGIFVVQDGEPKLLLRELWWNDDQALVIRATEADWKADPKGSVSDFFYACETGVAAYERLSRFADPGWKRFLLYITGVNVILLSTLTPQAPESVVFAEWVVATCNTVGSIDHPHAVALREVKAECMKIIASSAAASYIDSAGDNARALVAERLPPRMDFPEPISYDYLEWAESTIVDMRGALHAAGLEASPIDIGDIGRALLVVVDTNFAVVVRSARGSKPDLVYVVGGVKHHISAPAERVLSACNEKNLEERVASCHFYPETYGGTVILRVGIWPAALKTIPDLLKAIVEEVASGATSCSQEFGGRGISGSTFGMTQDEIVGLARICCV